ncbi:unnamed protein product [Gongylonema pulchrum]|uniref:PWWP domain-containing protein n=1 Tax=Gongylonema pulchrum TaxID=637853 RepID=A0A183DQ57_9BILA|nr:unnamed protein product [Gongylonema pulchrum]
MPKLQKYCTWFHEIPVPHLPTSLVVWFPHPYGQMADSGGSPNEQRRILCYFRFPTLYWVPKNAKDKPVPYSGGREVDDFIKYIAKHATEELKGYTRDGKPKAKEEL